MTRLPLPRPDGVVRLYVNDGFKDVWTAPSMHAYSDACNAALREQVRVLREALVMCSTAGDGLTLAQEAQIRAALKASK